MPLTVQEMIKQVEQGDLENTAARSVANPGVLTTGGTVGATGQGIPSTSIVNQAFTRPRADYVAPTVSTPQGTQVAANVDYGVDAEGRSLAPKVSDIYKGLIPGSNAELQAAYDAQGNLIRETQKPIDEAAIREQTMQRFQAEIDALNRYYAEKKAGQISAERKVGEARLGSGAAIQARRGLIGSSFGEAQTAKAEEYNKSVEQAIAERIDAERASAVQSILGKARSESQDEINAKVTARSQGAQAYVNFLKGAAERKEERVSNTLANIFNNDLSPDEQTYKQLAEQLGVSVEELKGRYKKEKASFDLTKEKTKPKPIVIGGAAYEVQADGTYKQVTPSSAEKPIIVGGVAYTKQDDGTYKAVTPEKAPEPIVRTYKGQIQVSLDGGKTFTRSGSSAPAGRTGRVTGISESKKTANAFNKIQQGLANSSILGPDGYISPQDYLELRNSWIAEGLNPSTFDSRAKGYRNPNNTNYVVNKQ